MFSDRRRLVTFVIIAVLAITIGIATSRAIRVPVTGVVGVVEVPATPSPTPSPTPMVTPTPQRVVVDDSSDDCPPGCTCDRRPNGIIIRCGG